MVLRDLADPTYEFHALKVSNSSLLTGVTDGCFGFTSSVGASAKQNVATLMSELGGLLFKYVAVRVIP